MSACLAGSALNTASNITQSISDSVEPSAVHFLHALPARVDKIPIVGRFSRYLGFSGSKPAQQPAQPPISSASSDTLADSHTANDLPTRAATPVLLSPASSPGSPSTVADEMPSRPSSRASYASSSTSSRGRRAKRQPQPQPANRQYQHLYEYRDGLLSAASAAAASIVSRLPFASSLADSFTKSTEVPAAVPFVGASKDALQGFRPSFSNVSTGIGYGTYSSFSSMNSVSSLGGGFNSASSSRRSVSSLSFLSPPPPTKLSFSFSGCSWLVFYELGVARCLKEYIKPHLMDECLFLGASTGALVATALALDMDLMRLKDALKDVSMVTSTRLLGPFSVMSEMLRGMIEALLPSDVSMAQSRLCISLTEFPSMTNRIASHYDSREDLVDHLLATCFVPLVYETPVKLQGRVYMDGGLSNNTPVLDSLTVTIGTRPNATNICPSVQPDSKDGARHPGAQQLLPSHDAAAMDRLFEDGYCDARCWLREHVSEGNLTALLFNKRP
ncbi:acyl transferase/acyl hydrolase/lysophospholipase [Entophlyctis helioformis]|nr:acyl transferase/acyl hydrolase/lysophospholipase [Entophlyctis helioformis]